MSTYHKQKGLVILLVLVFMQLLALLNWYAIQSVFLLEKLSKNAMFSETLYYQAKQELSHAETLLMLNLPDCMIPVTDVNQLQLKPLDWWTAKSCSGNFQSIQYYYVVESLMTDACAIIDQVQNTSAAYFRITVFLYSTVNGAKIFMQSTLVRPNVSQQPCKGVPHPILPGRQSWRELINY